MKNLFLLLSFVLLFAGCTFTQHTHIAWLDPAYAPNSGQTVFDLMNQKPKTNVKTYRDGEIPDHPYHSILMLSVEGNGNQEPDSVATFIDLSRRAGADAVLIARPSSGLSIRKESGKESATAKANGDTKATEEAESAKVFADEISPRLRYIFQATAVVWNSTTNGTKN